MVEGPVAGGAAVGGALAFLEASVSVASLRWALRRPCFNRVWMGGVAVRLLLLVFVAVAFSQQSVISLASLLATLVVVNTAFMVLEAALFLKH